MSYKMIELEDWYKVALFACPMTGDSRKLGACLGYMMRELSHRRIPSPKLVNDVLEGKLTVPDCGYINCLIGYEHVH